MNRRHFLNGVCAAALAPVLMPRPARAGASSGPTTPDALIQAARDLARHPYAPRPQVLAPPFDGLSYDSHRGIRPRSGYAADLALGPEFVADLLPPGWLFADPVSIALPGHDTDFSAQMFSFDPRYFSPPPEQGHLPDMGFSGLRLRHQLNSAGNWDEVLVLQGASYFRALAKDTVYGLSARALSLGTGGPTAEEFPVTRYIAVFEAGKRLHFGCLIDSPRASAALIATLEPGQTTSMECSLHLFARTRIDDAGIAPLTSMFQHNALGPAAIDDFRPAVHDSDVLVIDNGAGERLWRPLANPAQVQISAFVDTNPRGFGLVQMPTAYNDFHDQEGAYHRRPTAWVIPQGDWGAGAVTLLEIPTPNEFADNIVAFWRPAAALDAGEHRFDYRLDWCAPGPASLPAQDYPLLPLRSASGIEPNLAEGRLFVIDFAPVVAGLDGIAPALVQLDFGDDDTGTYITGAAFYRLHADDPALRASFVFTPPDDMDVAELRLRLRQPDGALLAPVWLYRWTRSREGGV
ncbi:glucan biosynthesis protein [Roseinatronobacter sp.]|uniref:glucan biosynthesis protein n=1 Tax=Roseinatronobacter sp. TaxID=1945755 RepID=UPI003F6E6BB5